MIINFTKRVRKLLSVGIIALVLVTSGGVYFYNDKKGIPSANLANEKEINRYTIDVVFDDESKRLMCNQNIEYVNNTKST